MATPDNSHTKHPAGGQVILGEASSGTLHPLLFCERQKEETTKVGVKFSETHSFSHCTLGCTTPLHFSVFPSGHFTAKHLALGQFTIRCSPESTPPIPNYPQPSDSLHMKILHSNLGKITINTFTLKKRKNCWLGYLVRMSASTSSFLTLNDFC